VGNLWLRDYFTPSCQGDLTPYVRHYARKAGVTLDRQKAIYYLVHLLVRSVLTMPVLVRLGDWKSTLALNLGYQAVCDIACCEAIGLYHGLDEEPVEAAVPAATGDGDELHELLARQLELGVAPELPEGFAKLTAAGGALIARYLARRQRHGAAADALERQGIEAILGRRFADLRDARHALASVLPELDEADEIRVLRHCSAVARRNMQLMEPLVARWSYCKLATLC